MTTKKLVLATLCTALIIPVTHTGGACDPTISPLTAGAIGAATGLLTGGATGAVIGKTEGDANLIPQLSGLNRPLLRGGLFFVVGFLLNNKLSDVVWPRVADLCGIANNRQIDRCLAGCDENPEACQDVAAALLAPPVMFAATSYLCSLGSYCTAYVRRVKRNHHEARLAARPQRAVQVRPEEFPAE